MGRNFFLALANPWTMADILTLQSPQNSAMLSNSISFTYSVCPGGEGLVALQIRIGVRTGGGFAGPIA